MIFKTNPFFTLKPNQPVSTEEEEQVDWKTFEPGTPEWIVFWKKHPEMQEEMLEYKNKEWR